MATTQAPRGERVRPTRRPFFWLSRPFLLLATAAWFSVVYHFREHAGPELLFLGSLAIGGLVIATGARTGLLSPVFYYDLIRTARRGQLQAHRFLFTVFLTAALLLVYLSYVPGGNWWSPAVSLQVPNHELPAFSWSFVSRVLLLQYLAVLLVTPAYVAPALAQEKQQRTLEFLLTTDLSDREIVLGLLGARLANLLLLVAAGLPVLGFLQFLGGVDPQLVLAGFALVVLTMLSVGSLSMVVSVFAPRTIPALLHAYIWLSIFVLATLCVPVLNFANPVIAALWVTLDSATDSLTVRIAQILAAGIALHGLVTFVLCRAAIREFRAASLQQNSGPPGRGPRMELLPAALDVRGWDPMPLTSDEPPLVARRLADELERPRRLVGDDALIWKETLSPITRRALLAAVTPFRLGLAAFCFLLFLIYHLAFDVLRTRREGETDYLNNLFRVPNTMAVCLVLITAAINAAGRVSREREQQTLDSLRTLPVSVGEILFAKWLGSVWSVLPVCGLLGLAWGFALLVTALHAAALPLLLAGCLIYLTFAASLGLWFSTVMRTTLRGTLFTVLVSLLLLTGAASIMRGESMVRYNVQTPWPERLFDHVTSPAQTLWSLSFSGDTLLTSSGAVRDVIVAVIALHVFAGVTVLMWWSMLRRFEEEKGPPVGDKVTR